MVKPNITVLGRKSQVPKKLTNTGQETKSPDITSPTGDKSDSEFSTSSSESNSINASKSDELKTHLSIYDSSPEQQQHKEIEEINTFNISVPPPKKQTSRPTSKYSTPVIPPQPPLQRNESSASIENLNPAEAFRIFSKPRKQAEVYNLRYSEKPGEEKSAYDSRFSEDILVVDGEKKVFFRAIEKTKPALIKKISQWKGLEEIKNLEGQGKDGIFRFYAIDWGCGSGRTLELWQQAAADLQKLVDDQNIKKGGDPIKVALRVISYDIVPEGLKSYQSKLTHPRLPKKYADRLKKFYGEEEYQNRRIEDDFPNNNDYEVLEAQLKEEYAQDYGEAYIPYHGEAYGREVGIKKAQDEIATLKKEMARFSEIDPKTLGEEEGNFYESGRYTKEALKASGLKEKPLAKDYGIYTHDDLEIQFLYGSPNISPEQLKKVFQQLIPAYGVHYSSIAYGGMCHISKEEKREGHIKTLKDVTNEDAYSSLFIAGAIYFMKQIEAYKTMHEHGLLGKSRIRPGDILYKPTEIETDPLFFATYIAEQLIELVKKIGDPQHDEISIATTANPTEISNANIFYRTLDRVRSEIGTAMLNLNYAYPFVPLPQSATDAGYYGYIMKGACREKSVEQNDAVITQTSVTADKSDNEVRPPSPSIKTTSGIQLQSSNKDINPDRTP